MKKEIKWSLISITLTLILCTYVHVQKVSEYKHFQKSMDSSTYFSLLRITNMFEDAEINLGKLLLSEGDRGNQEHDLDQLSEEITEVQGIIRFMDNYRQFQFTLYADDVIDDLYHFSKYYGTERMPVTDNNRAYLSQLIEVASASSDIINQTIGLIDSSVEPIETSNVYAQMNRDLVQVQSVDLGHYVYFKDYGKKTYTPDLFPVKEVYPDTFSSKDAIAVSNHFYETFYGNTVALHYDGDIESDEFGNLLVYSYDLNGDNAYFEVMKCGGVLTTFDVYEEDSDSNWPLFNRSHTPLELNNEILNHALEKAREVLQKQDLQNHKITKYRRFGHFFRFYAYIHEPYLNELSEVYIDIDMQSYEINRYDSRDFYTSKLYDYSGFDNAKNHLEACKKVLESKYHIIDETLVVYGTHYHSSGIQWVWRFEIVIGKTHYNVDIDTTSLSVSNIQKIEKGQLF